MIRPQFFLLAFPLSFLSTTSRYHFLFHLLLKVLLKTEEILVRKRMALCCFQVVRNKNRKKSSQGLVSFLRSLMLDPDCFDLWQSATISLMSIVIPNCFLLMKRWWETINLPFFTLFLLLTKKPSKFG